jgi:hypothetical protein
MDLPNGVFGNRAALSGRGFQPRHRVPDVQDFQVFPHRLAANGQPTFQNDFRLIKSQGIPFQRGRLMRVPHEEIAPQRRDRRGRQRPGRIDPPFVGIQRRRQIRDRCHRHRPSFDSVLSHGTYYALNLPSSLKTRYHS